MFRVFACKQVFDISATFFSLYKRRDLVTPSPICPFCTQNDETAGHVLLCPEEGQVELIKKYSCNLLDWLNSKGVPQDLTYLMVAFIQRRGTESMEQICHCLLTNYLSFAPSQDAIGWRRFMGGMVSKELLPLLMTINHRMVWS
jgi:hypothetical protein